MPDNDELIADKELTERLITYLATLYRIRYSDDIKASLDYEIRVLEKRLHILGFADYDGLKPQRRSDN